MIRLFTCLTLLLSSPAATTLAGKINQDHKETRRQDLEIQQLIAHIAYQLGKDDDAIPKPPLHSRPATTANGELSAIQKLTPFSGSKLDADEIHGIYCNAILEWPNQKTAKTDEELPLIMVMSYCELNTGRSWTKMARPLLKIYEGNPAKCESMLGMENKLQPGDYSVTAMLFVRLSPEKPPTLLDVKTTEFVVETPSK